MKILFLFFGKNENSKSTNSFSILQKMKMEIFNSFFNLKKRTKIKMLRMKSWEIIELLERRICLFASDRI